MIPTERRRFPRFPFHSKGFLSADGRQHLGTVIDVSLKGALFSSVENLCLGPGTSCQLEIFHAGQEEVCVATAVVAYIREDLIGLQLIDTDQLTQEILSKVIAMNLGVDSLLSRDLGELSPVDVTAEQ